MNLQKEPFEIDFIGNHPEWKVKTSPYYTPGRKCSVSFAVTALVPGHLLWLETPHGDFQWNIEQYEDADDVMSMSAANTLNEVIDALERKMRYRQDLCEHYDVSFVSGSSYVAVTVTAKEEGPVSPLVLYADTTPYPVLTSTSGLARNDKDGYKIAARLDYVRNGISWRNTPWLYFDDGNGTVTIPANILESCFPKRDIPRYNESVGVYPCNGSLLHARLLFAEFFDGIMHVVKTSSRRTFIHGKIGQYEAENNIPDWVAADNDKFYRKSKIDIFGQDNNAVVATDVETEQYLYISNFTANAIGPVNLSLTTVSTSGTTTGTVAALTFSAKTVNRIPVGVTALGIDAATVLSYTVSVAHGTNTISRTFNIVPRPYHSRTLLLVNRVGLYESFVIDNISVENETSGNRAIVDNIDGYDVEDQYVSITARTGRHSHGQLDLLKYATSADDNLMLDGPYAWRISIKPGSIKVVDENEDLNDAEFTFLAVEKIDRRRLVITEIEQGTIIRMNDNIIDITNGSER